LKEIAAQVDVKSVDIVLIVGGDGSVHEFLNAYIQTHENGLGHFTKTALCPVPAGTSNGFAISLGFTTALQAVTSALQVLCGSCMPRPVDIYSVSRTEADAPKLFDFHLTCWGIMADVDLALERAPRWVPGILRDGLKLLIPILHICKLQARRGSVIIHTEDGSTFEESGEFLLIGIQNVRWTDASIQLAPAAQLDDGLLHICLWRKGSSRIGAMSTFMAMESGSHVHMKHIRMCCARSVELCPETGEMDVCGTGESGLPAPMGGRIKIDVLPSAIRVT
jgi:sphingosine kinase